ncbi:MAG: hypothetical protein ABIF19_20795, partial [Planctomycetota bacterium]
KKHTFFSALAVGICAIGVGFIVSCTVTIIYGMHSATNEPERLVSLIENAVRWVPAVRGSWPPALSDVLDDRREPDYRDQLDITARTELAADSNGRVRTVVTVVNSGAEIVSLLSLRVVVLDSAGKIIAESSEFAATPLAAEGHWRGPLMPGSTRHFNCSDPSAVQMPSSSVLRTAVEITDIRVWGGARQTWPGDSKVCPVAK